MDDGPLGYIKKKNLKTSANSFRFPKLLNQCVMYWEINPCYQLHVEVIDHKLEHLCPHFQCGPQLKFVISKIQIKCPPSPHP